MAGTFRTLVVLLGALLWFPLPAHALDPIDTDGPDFVESSEVVPKGRFQYEIDMTSVRDLRPASAGTAVSTPTLLRYGATDHLEIRIAPEGFIRQGGMSGTGDIALGIKWHSHDGSPYPGNAAVSWILHVDTPSGSDRFRGNGLRPSLRSVITWDLPFGLALGVMPGVKSDTRADGHRFASAIFGSVLNKRINNRFRVFGELSVPQVARSANGGVLADWDLGAAYLVTPDLQVGIRAGIAANRNSPTSYTLLELAQRF